MYKNKIKALLVLLAIVASIPIVFIAISQTKWFRKELETLLKTSAEKSGLNLSIGAIEGSLPLQWKISHIALQKPGEFSISIQEVSLRLAFLPLLRKEIEVSYLHVDDATVSLQKYGKGNQGLFSTLSCLPLDLSLRSFHIERLTWITPDSTSLGILSAQGNFTITREAKEIAIELHVQDLENDNRGVLSISGGRLKNWLSVEGSLKSPLGEAELVLKLDSNLSITEGEFRLELVPFEKGKLKIEQLTSCAKLEHDHLHLIAKAKNIEAGSLELDSWQATMEADYQNFHWEGTLNQVASRGQISAQLFASYVFDMKAHTLILQEIDLKAPSISSGGHMALTFSPFSLTGSMRLQADDLSQLQAFLPSWYLAGGCGGSLYLTNNDDVQNATLELLISDLHFRDLHIGRCDLYAHLVNPLQHVEGKVDLEAERIYFTHTYLSSLSLHAFSDHLDWPLRIGVEGTWKYPFSLNTAALLQHNHEGTTLQIDILEGHFFEQPLCLKQPMQITWQPETLQLQNLKFEIGEGLLQGNFKREPKQLSLALQGSRMPLSWLTLLTPYLTFKGESSLDCHMIATPDGVQGSCRIDLTHAEATKSKDQKPLYVRGSIEANIHSDTLQIHSNIQASEQQIMLLHLSLPILYTPSPYTLQIAPKHPLSGSFEIEGKLEELFTFANTGSQEISGWLAGKVYLFGTPHTPLLQGNLTLQQGRYENHFVGFGMRDIDAEFHAMRDRLFVDRFIGRDTKKGSLQIEGEILLDIERYFPYHLSGKLERFHAIRLDLVEAELSGPLTLDGNLRETILRGTLSIDAADTAIPKSLPQDLPDLPYVFSKETPALPISTPKKSFPFAFDILFNSDDTILFQGNGLTSVWGGQVHLRGVNLNLLASGNLRLAKGQFQILGKTFLLQQGEITFSDKPGHEGFINMSGTLSLQETTITAQLRGTLSSPQLSFHASPALTTTEIFSLLLFNKRVSEIKPVQAVQLAHTILTFYGHTGWNPVTQIGTGLSNFGIDTFDIIPSEEGLKQSSITIGKHFYLVRNMLITLTQSLDSRRFMVEVDLGKGLLFQAENQSGAEQSQQEGKFSLKWNKNY